MNFLDELTYLLLDSCDEKTAGELFVLYQEAGFLDDGDSWEYIPEMVRGSFAFIAVFSAGRLIGGARAISDGISDAYIQDVVVAEEFRTRGVGGELVDRLTAYLKSQNISWIGLIAVAGREHFYSRHGFEKLDMTPMIFNGKAT